MGVHSLQFSPSCVGVNELLMIEEKLALSAASYQWAHYSTSQQHNFFNRLTFLIFAFHLPFSLADFLGPIAEGR